MRNLILLIALLTLAGCGDNASAFVSGGVTRAESSLQNLARNVQQMNAFNAQVWGKTACLAPYGQMVHPSQEVPGYVNAVIELCGIPPGLMKIPSQR